MLKLDAAFDELQAANDNLHPVHLAIVQGLIDPKSAPVRGLGVYLRLHVDDAYEGAYIASGSDYNRNGVAFISRDPLALFGQEAAMDRPARLSRIRRDLGPALHRDTHLVMIERAHFAAVAPPHTPAKRKAEAGRMRLLAAGEIVAMLDDEEEERRDRVTFDDIIEVKRRYADAMPKLLKAANENLEGYEHRGARRHPP